MKKIEAIIRKNKLDDILDALREYDDFSGMTISDVQGFGEQKGKVELYRGAEYVLDFLPKTKIEIFTSEDKVETLSTIILKAAKTGKMGDGVVAVYDLDSLKKIRTGEIKES